MRSFFIHLQLREMRSFWFVFFSILAVITIGFLYQMPIWWLVFGAVVVVSTSVIVYLKNIKLYKVNLGTQLEKIELSSIIANLNDGIVAYSPDFKVLIFNHAAERIFAFTEGEIVGQVISPVHAQNERFRPLVQVFFPALAPVSITRSETGKYPQVIDMSLESPVLDLRITTTRILDPKNQLLGFVKIIHDRTRELQLLKSKSDFIAVAAHQLRTPLTSVHWAVDILVKEASKFGEEQNKMMAMISQSTNKLLGIVDDLLNAAKIEEGRFGYSFNDLDLIPFINELLSATRDRVKEYGINVFFDRPKEKSMVVKADGRKLEMAFSNLIDNAIRYNVKNGEVSVRLERLKDKPFVRISIKDTGIGISGDDLKKIFNKFYRSENAIKIQTAGSGLGLFICKNIIERHGGQIWAESELDRGTTLYVTLPTDPKLIPSKERIYSE